MKVTEMNVLEVKQENYWKVSIDPFYEPDNKKRAHIGRVSVWSEYGYYEKNWTPAQVSWFAMGTVSAAEAEAFQKSLETAVLYARKMDAEHGIE
jgi:hypothetical protein